MITVPKLTLEDAKIILQGAEKKAREIGVDMDIAVVDDGGNLLAFYRMDKAKITSIDVAINKAFTAAGARKGTHEYAEIAGPGKPAFGIHVSNRGRFMILGGGLPIFVDGQIVGGIGCSSGTVDEDRIVAQAGIDAFMAYLDYKK
ncbi:MAG TPA: heme-binding protein [Thermodesulfobacteriota bacterium]|nr:heme-binding protein [Thermodesulfobacteriota bacterium]